MVSNDPWIFQAEVKRRLKDFTSSDWRVRRAAVYASGWFCDEQILKALLQALNDPDARVRFAAVDALVRTANRLTPQVLVDLLRDPSEEVRQAAGQALAKTGDSRIADGLILLLRDPSEEVRQASVSALTKLSRVLALPRKYLWSAYLVLKRIQGRDLAAIPRKLIADSTLTPHEKCVLFEEFRRAPDTGGISQKGMLPEISVVSRRYLKDRDIAVREGARTVLQYWEAHSKLLRAADSAGNHAAELLRPAQGASCGHSSTLVRPVEGSAKP